MSYTVRCECGKTYSVERVDAGVSFPCACGRTVDVPALHVLRGLAGEPPGGSPLWALQAGFASGSLPGLPVCACCRRESGRQVVVAVHCEEGRGGVPALVGEVGSGCFMVALMFVVGIFVFSREMIDAPTSASGLRVTVPIFVCESCDRLVTTPAALRNALRVVPEYALLLDRYPAARVCRVTAPST